jgi:hypothetical protein
MENVLNNLLLLIESNCNEGTYIKASNMIKEVYDIQPEEVIILKKEIEELNEYKKKSIEKEMELLQEIRELNKELRNKSIN